MRQRKQQAGWKQYSFIIDILLKITCNTYQNHKAIFAETAKGNSKIHKEPQNVSIIQIETEKEQRSHTS